MSVRFTGPWGKVLTRLGQPTEWLIGTADPPLRAFGEKLQVELKKRVLASPPPPLKPTTVAIKEMEGAPFPLRSWYEWGTLANTGFKQPEVRRASSGSKLCSILVSEETHTSGLSMATLFRFLEFGTRYMQARPVLAPLLRDLETGKLPALREFHDEYVLKIRQEL